MFHSIDTIYCDFDGTITQIDAINTFFSKYAQDEWLQIEQDWADEKIGSMVCMKKQTLLVQNLDKKEFYNYLDSIKISDGFVDFCNSMKKLGKKIIILSDGFDVFIDYILKKNGLNDIDFYSNKLIVKEELGKLNFDLEFPYADKNCEMELGVCKCRLGVTKKTFMYIGDGLSDRCIAKYAGLLFAKDKRDGLKDYCIKKGINFFTFDNFYDILDYINEEYELCKV